MPAVQRPAVAPPPAATAPPRVAPPAASGPSPERVTIAPAAAQGNAGTIEFDWEAVGLGTNRSFTCIVTTDDDQGLAVSVEQGIYRRSFNGTAVVKVPVIPPAIASTSGSLTARNLATGASATYSWQWQPMTSPAAQSPAPQKGGGLLGRLFGRAKAAPAQVKAKSAVKALSVAERLGTRASLGVQLKFFGQPAVGQRFAFILDMSGSMRGQRWDACVRQLESTLKGLPPHVEIVLYLFSHGTIEHSEQSGWKSADPEWVNQIITWVRNIRPGGGTLPANAFQRAFSLPDPPDVIYFLTDGEVEYFGADTCARIRGEALTVVNTIALEGQQSAAVLKEIADMTGGQFIAIPDATAGGTSG